MSTVWIYGRREVAAAVDGNSRRNGLRRQPPCRRNGLSVAGLLGPQLAEPAAVEHDGRDLGMHRDTADPQNDNGVIAGGHHLLDRALQPHAGAFDEDCSPLETVCSPAKRSPVLAASVRAASSCDSPSTLMPRTGSSRSLGQVADEFCTQNDTSGGSSETGTKVLAARPTRAPSTSAAIAITPDGKCPNASRREVGVKSLPALIALKLTRTRRGEHRSRSC